MATTDDTQMYVTGVLYQSDAFPDSPDDVFDVVDKALREIDNLDFRYLCINRTEARFSGGTTREQLLIFMKEITYNSNQYLSDSASGTLRTAIIGKLNGITDLTYNDVEIRSTRTTT